MLIDVITVAIDKPEGEPHSVKACNLKSVSGQRWLINHFNWALNNGFGVALQKKVFDDGIIQA